MYDCIVSDTDIISYMCSGFLVGTVNDGAILYVHFPAHPDNIHVAPYHRVEPYTALVAHDHIAYDGGIRGDITIGAQNRHNAFYRKYYRHDVLFRVG